MIAKQPFIYFLIISKVTKSQNSKSYNIKKYLKFSKMNF